MTLKEMTFNVATVASGVAGTPIYFSLNLTENGKLVLETSGNAALVGIWGPFPHGVTPVDEPPYGLLRVCGAGAWGCRMFIPGQYLVRVTPTHGGATTLKLRSWNLTDYLMINLHPSSC